MCTIYDQNLIFVVYEAGYSGSFLSALLQSVLFDIDVIISSTGHGHYNTTRSGGKLTKLSAQLQNYIDDTSYFDKPIIDRTNHEMTVIEVTDVDDFKFYENNFHWHSVVPIKNNIDYDLLPPTFFNSIVLQYYTPVSELVSMFVLRYPEFKHIEGWLLEHINDKQVNTIVYALWCWSRSYDIFTNDDRPNDKILEIPVRLLRNNDPSLVPILETILDMQLTERQRLMTFESLQLYNQIVFDGRPVGTKADELERIYRDFLSAVQWLRTKPWLK